LIGIGQFLTADILSGSVHMPFDEKEQVIAYMSKALNKAEQSYCVTRKELLAVVFSFKHFHIHDLYFTILFCSFTLPLLVLA
jgi:hypothetical protein